MILETEDWRLNTEDADVDVDDDDNEKNRNEDAIHSPLYNKFER